MRGHPSTNPPVELLKGPATVKLKPIKDLQMNPVNLEHHSISEAYLKLETGRANILAHLVIILKRREPDGPIKEVDKESLIDMAENYCATSARPHTYFSIYDFDGQMLETNFPFEADGRQ